MDFLEIIEKAHDNTQKNKNTAYGYSTNPISKKPDGKRVDPNAIKSFLAKKEEVRKDEAIKRREERNRLLAARAQNSKSNKKAKLMSSRTKENNFGKIVLTEDEVKANEERETKIERANMSNKVDRMRMRIELEEEDSHVKKKKKYTHHHTSHKSPEEPKIKHKKSDFNPLSLKLHAEEKEVVKSKPIKKNNAPISFEELMKIAKQNGKNPNPAPLLKKKKVEEERPMTNEQKIRYMEEQLRKKGVSVNSLHKASGATSKQPNRNSQSQHSKYRSDEDTPVRPSSSKESYEKGNTQKKHVTFNKRPTVEEEEEDDYYDEDDDFIDDDFIDDNGGYDQDEIRKLVLKNKHHLQRNFIEDDDDDDLMETSFAQQMQEEQRSLRIGKAEDLEELRKEKEEEKRKKLKKR